MEQDLIREGTNLNRYHINYLDGRVDGIIYKGERQSLYYTIENAEKYAFFWEKVFTRGFKPLSFLGKHSLIIYLLHQPVIYGVLTGLFMLGML